MKRDYVPLFASINTSEKVADLPSDSVRLFYVLLLPQCDSWGRVTAKARTLGSKVWPLLGKHIRDTEGAILYLASAGLIEVHHDGTEGSPWIQIPDWEEKAGRTCRRDRRGPSEFPDPSRESLRTYGQLVDPPKVDSVPGGGEPVENLPDAVRRLLFEALIPAGLTPLAVPEAMELLNGENWLGGFQEPQVRARLEQVAQAAQQAEKPGALILWLLREDSAGRTGTITVRGPE